MKQKVKSTAKISSTNDNNPIVETEEIEKNNSDILETSEENETRRNDEISDETTEEIQATETVLEPKKNGVPEQASTLLVNKIYRLKREIDEKERKLERDRKTFVKWQTEDEDKLKSLNEKFEADKVNKIIEYHETGCLQGKIVLIDYYQKQLEKLLSEKTEQEESGNHGDFSNLYKEYMKTRSERFEKNLANLQKNYFDSTKEKRDVTIPKLETAISELKEELLKAETEAEKYQKV
jgi:hypothetical protein